VEEDQRQRVSGYCVRMSCESAMATFWRSEAVFAVEIMEWEQSSMRTVAHDD